MLFGALLPLRATSISFTDVGGAACGTAGLCSSQPGATTVTFDGLTAGTSSGYNSGIATYTWNGSQSPFVLGSLTNNWASPPNDTTTYLTLGSPNLPSSVTIGFSSPITYFGFYMGSPDDYNHVAFYQHGNLVQSYAGDQLIAPGDHSWSTGRFVSFCVQQGSVDQVVMSSTGVAFETDNHAYVTATPEPGTLSMLGMGLALAGFEAFRRFRSAR
jgi:hypothetical protein